MGADGDLIAWPRSLRAFRQRLKPGYISAETVMARKGVITVAITRSARLALIYSVPDMFYSLILITIFVFVNWFRRRAFIQTVLHQGIVFASPKWVRADLVEQITHPLMHYRSVGPAGLELCKVYLDQRRQRGHHPEHDRLTVVE